MSSAEALACNWPLQKNLTTVSRRCVNKYWPFWIYYTFFYYLDPSGANTIELDSKPSWEYTSVYNSAYQQEILAKYARNIPTMLSKDKEETVLVILPNVSRGSPQTVAGKIGHLNNTQIPAIPREAEVWKLLMGLLLRWLGTKLYRSWFGTGWWSSVPSKSGTRPSTCSWVSFLNTVGCT